MLSVLGTIMKVCAYIALSTLFLAITGIVSIAGIIIIREMIEEHWE